MHLFVKETGFALLCSRPARIPAVGEQFNNGCGECLCSHEYIHPEDRADSLYQNYLKCKDLKKSSVYAYLNLRFCVLCQWLSNGDDFAPQDTFGSVGRYQLLDRGEWGAFEARGDAPPQIMTQFKCQWCRTRETDLI